MNDLNSQNRIPEDVRAAIDEYHRNRSAASWTSLSQLWVRGGINVFDAVKLVKPDFPEPLPVPVDGVLEESGDFFQWAVLPEPEDVRRGIECAMQRWAF